MANLPILGTAPDFTGISAWINSDPLTMASLKGKVVLVDFWTYSCINCIRTLPHVTSWYDTYKDQGFVVVGVHSPEFAFEKVTENVKKAAVQYGIHYPIAQDNDLATWSAYNNQYWPAHYLIDAQGKVRETHFGEGNYDETEASIRALLAEAHAAAVLPTVVPNNDTTPTNSSTPETYLGSARRSHFVEGVAASALRANQWTLTGKWQEDEESITSLEKDAGLSFNFGAQDVYLVINPPAGVTASVKVLIDGQPASSDGTDVVGGVVAVNTDRLYHLAHFSKKESHVLMLVFQTVGTKAFAFT